MLPHLKEPKEQNKLHGYITVFTGVLIHLFCGNLYLWGNVSNYVVSYYHFKGDENAKLSSALMVLPISFII